MGKFRFLAMFTVVCLLSSHSLSHADIDELLSRYGGENGKGYVQPLATGFGAGLNSGLYNSARIKRFGLHFQLDLRLMMMLYTDGQRTFEASTSGHFYPPAKVVVPTIIGDGGGAEVTGQGGTKYHFPGGLEMDALFLACPQVTVGSFFGTEGTIRFMSLPLGEDVGTMRLWGVGVRHSLSQYISMTPVDLAIGTFYQKFTLGDIMDASLLSVHMIASKSLPLVTFYGGVGYEDCTMHVEYTLDVDDLEPPTIEFDLQGKNRFRATLGVGLRLVILNVNADLSFGRQTVVSVGVGPGI
jgi:hypothetical protein